MFVFLASVLLLVLPFLSFLFLIKANFFTRRSSSVPTFENPRSYPIIGSYFDIAANLTQFNQWSTEILRNSPTATYVLHGVFGYRQIMTADPANVQHMLKTKFSLYTKGENVRAALFDLLGTGIFNADGEQWRFQRQIASHEFNSRSLRNFIENVVKAELSDRLIPVLSTAAADKNSVLDLQNILQRFGFDNVCKIAFGFDPEYLLPSLPTTEFSTAFAEATRISSGRFISPIPLVWKLKQVLNIGSERKLKLASSTIRQYAKKIIAQKKKEQSSIEATDLLSRFLNYGNLDEELLIDIVISFILAGQDTTSAALTWFFYIISRNSKAEEGILKEINELPDDPGYDEMKDMIYTHSSLCESMRLYPPVPSDTKEAVGDDVLPDGTVVKKGMRVSYHPYAMGRMEKLWGKDWMDFKPERWLTRDASTGKLSFNGRDSYTYPVFQAGPRTCLGKDMSFLQMKMLVVGILGRFRIVPTAGDGFEPVYISHLTSKMKDGFPVRIEPRVQGQVFKN